MRNFRLSFIGVACGSLILGFALPTLAQGTPSTKELLERVETLTHKVQILEQRLEREQESATAKAKEAPLPEAREERVEALDQKVRILERRWELEQETATAKAKEAPVFAAGKDGFFLKSADGNFQLRVRGYLQADGRFFADDQDHVGTDTFLMRRVRPIFEGTVYKYFDFRIMPGTSAIPTCLPTEHKDRIRSSDSGRTVPALAQRSPMGTKPGMHHRAITTGGPSACSGNTCGLRKK